GPLGAFALESVLTTDLAVVGGGVTTRADRSRATVDRLVRDAVREIGYVDPTIGFAADTCQVICKLHSQSPHIAMGVDTGGAGDPGMMFGFAPHENSTPMPPPLYPAPPPLREHPAPAPRRGPPACPP